METALSQDEEVAFETAELEQFIAQAQKKEPLHPLAEERILKQTKLAIATERVIALERRYALIVAELVEINSGKSIPVARNKRLNRKKAETAKTLNTIRNEYLKTIAETTGLNKDIATAQIATHALIRVLQPPEELEPYETEPVSFDEFVEAA